MFRKGIQCCTKNVFSKYPGFKSSYRSPLGPFVFNSKQSLSRTGLAGHPCQVFCPGSYPRKWQGVWHTFFVTKDVDNSTWGSKMTKIGPTPKHRWTQSSFHISSWRESLWKSFAVYKLICKCKAFFKKKKQQHSMWGAKVMLKSQDSYNTWLTEDRGTVSSTWTKIQKTWQDTFEKRIDLWHLVKIKRKF